jgi:hypothetical protein
MLMDMGSEGIVRKKRTIIQGRYNEKMVVSCGSYEDIFH